MHVDGDIFTRMRLHYLNWGQKGGWGSLMAACPPATAFLRACPSAAPSNAIINTRFRKQNNKSGYEHFLTGGTFVRRVKIYNSQGSNWGSLKFCEVSRQKDYEGPLTFGWGGTGDFITCNGVYDQGGWVL